MRLIPSLISLFLAAGVAFASPLEPILLWPEKAPGALDNRDEDKPSLTPFLPPPEKATGAAIVICPGGGYGGHAAHEGKPIAQWLNGLGGAGDVLQYRLA